MSVIKRARLINFRNYEQQEIELSPKINLFVGQNGQGKTNFLEALALFVAARSFRTSQLKDCIRHGQDGFHLHCLFEKEGIEQSLELSFSQLAKKLKYNSNTYSNFVPLIGILPGVLFAGFYDQLIKGAPQIRRRFVDLQCSQIDARYLDCLRHYNKTVKMRNVALKNSNTKMVTVYDQLLSQYIPHIVHQRLEGIKILQNLTQRKHQELTGLDDEIEISYISPFLSCQSKHDCLNLLKQALPRDMLLKSSSVGPHKDDIEIKLARQPAKKFGSEGQIQSLVSAIYLAEYERLKQRTNQTPLFFIDDLGQNLDPVRSEKLLKQLGKMGQVFITTPHLPTSTVFEESAIFEIQKAQISTLKPALSN